MKIVGTEGMNEEQIAEALEQGARFVIYEYCISALIITFKRTSDVHFIRPHEGSVGPGMKYTLMSLVAGWWGFPWGPIYTIWALVVNLRGGKDVTDELRGAYEV